MPRFRAPDEFGDVYRAFGERIAQERVRRSLSQRELAKRAGISHTVISRIEGGEHSASPKTLERLADALR